MPARAAVLQALWKKESDELEKRGEAANELNGAMEKLARKLRLSRLAMAELNRRRGHMAR